MHTTNAEIIFSYWRVSWWAWRKGRSCIADSVVGLKRERVVCPRRASGTHLVERACTEGKGFPLVHWWLSLFLRCPFLPLSDAPCLSEWHGRQTAKISLSINLVSLFLPFLPLCLPWACRPARTMTAFYLSWALIAPSSWIIMRAYYFSKLSPIVSRVVYVLFIKMLVRGFCCLPAFRFLAHHVYLA